VTLAADPRVLAEFDTAAHGWRIDRGNYQVGIGRDAGTIVASATIGMNASRMRPQPQAGTRTGK
jgi:beta-glucosidase